MLAATDLSALGTFGVMLDESRVYWIAGVDILAMPRPSGTPVALDYSSPGSFQLGMDEANIYQQGADGVSVRAKSGGPLVAIGEEPLGADVIAVNSECAYWSTSSVLTPHEVRVGAVAKSGGKAFRVAIGKGPRLLLAVDETGAYWSDSEGGTIKRVAR